MWLKETKFTSPVHVAHIKDCDGEKAYFDIQ